MIAEFFKYNYKNIQIGGEPEEERTVAIDETLINHQDGKQIWLVGGIDTTTKNVRSDAISERNSNNLKIFVFNHINPGTNITHDGWSGYNFLDGDDSVWTHEVLNHGHGDFSHGLSSTTYIEQYW